MEVRFTLDLPKETFAFLKEVADVANVKITDVVKEILNQRVNKEAKAS